MSNNKFKQNMYDTNINNTRNQDNYGFNINQNPYINQNMRNQMFNTNQTNTLLNGDFIKGALIGAVATYILTNKNAQENIFKAFMKTSELFSAGIEEMKERIEDAKAAINTSKEES